MTAVTDRPYGSREVCHTSKAPAEVCHARAKSLRILSREGDNLRPWISCAEGFKRHITAIARAVDNRLDLPQIGRLLVPLRRHSL